MRLLHRTRHREVRAQGLLTRRGAITKDAAGLAVAIRSEAAHELRST